MARFKEGDMVTIRKWDDMEKEYGLDYGYIKLPQRFIPSMKEYCGNMYTIKTVCSNCYILSGLGYIFSDEMFEESKEVSTPPKYWIVRRDNKNPLYKKCIEYINRKYNTAWDGYGYNYYGFDGNSLLRNGINLCDDIKYFINNPVLLTLEEWDKWFGGEEEKKVDNPSQFKVGDKVQIMKTSRWSPGEYGVIEEICFINEELTYYVHLDNSEYCYYLSGSYIKHIETSDTQFKVGDAVTIASGCKYGYLSGKMGVIREIKERAGEHIMVDVDTAGRWWLADSDIVPYKLHITSTKNIGTDDIKEFTVPQSLKDGLMLTGCEYPSSIVVDTGMSPSMEYSTPYVKPYGKGIAELINEQADKSSMEYYLGVDTGTSPRTLHDSYETYMGERITTKQSSIFTFNKLR